VGWKSGCGKLLTYENSCGITYADQVVGRVAWGGVHTQGTVMVSITGMGCAIPRNPEALPALVDTLRGRITRTDFALDLVDGNPSITDVHAAYVDGGFDQRGHHPTYEQQGDWEPHEGRGRTLYIGARKGASKRWCVYEKGKQLGDPESPWLRLELRLKRDKAYPIEVDYLRRRDEIFAGASPFAASLLGLAGESRRTTQVMRNLSVDQILSAIRQQYGGHLKWLRRAVRDDAALLNMLTLGARVDARRLLGDEMATRDAVRYICGSSFAQESEAH